MEGGECLLFPSKEMQDWSKFAWKKSDVLVNAHIIFEKFSNDTYTTFIGKYYCDGDDESGYSYISLPAHNNFILKKVILFRLIYLISKKKSVASSILKLW